MDAVATPNLEHVADEAAKAAGGEYRPEYNGWPNRETWNTHLWITNEENTYEMAREIVEQSRWAEGARPPYAPEGTHDVWYAAEQLREWWDDYNDEMLTVRNGPTSDAWSYMIACVDWRRIAEALLED